MNCGEERGTFYNFMSGSLYLNGSVTLGCDLHKCFSGFFCVFFLPFKKKKSLVVVGWMFPLL